MILNYLYFLPSIKWPKRVERHFSWLVPQLSSQQEDSPGCHLMKARVEQKNFNLLSQVPENMQINSITSGLVTSGLLPLLLLCFLRVRILFSISEIIFHQISLNILHFELPPLPTKIVLFLKKLLEFLLKSSMRWQ